MILVVFKDYPDNPTENGQENGWNKQSNQLESYCNNQVNDDVVLLVTRSCQTL